MGDPVSTAVIGEELIAPLFLSGEIGGGALAGDALMGAMGSGVGGAGMMAGGEMLGGAAGGFLGADAASYFAPGMTIGGYDEYGLLWYADALAPEITTMSGSAPEMVAGASEVAAPYAPPAPELPAWASPNGGLNTQSVLQGINPGVVDGPALLNPQFASNIGNQSLNDIMTQAAGGAPTGGTGSSMLDASLTNGGSLSPGGPYAYDSAGNFAPGSGGMTPDWQKYALKAAPDVVRLMLSQSGAAQAPLRQLQGGIQQTLDNINQNAFPFAKYQQLADQFADPAKRMQMLENSPAYQESKKAIMAAQQRNAAKTGTLNPQSNNWAVPMANVIAQNAQKWDTQNFDQAAQMSGMKFAPGQNAGSVISGLSNLYNAQQGNNMSKGVGYGNIAQTATDYLSKVLA